MKQESNFLFSVEEWSLKPFFLDIYVKEEAKRSEEEKLEMFWALLNKVLLARASSEEGIKADKKKVDDNLKVLSQVKRIKDALKREEIEEEDLLFFLRLENLAESFEQKLKTQVLAEISENPEYLRELYEKQGHLVIKDAREIYEVWVKDKDFNWQENKLYTQDELPTMSRINKLGIFSEADLGNLDPGKEYDFVRRKEGELVPVDEEGEERLFYFFRYIHPEFRQEFESVKDDFKLFMLDYLLEDTLEEIYGQLLDKYEVEFNEEYLKKIFKG